jgi:hypothetical protein
MRTNSCLIAIAAIFCATVLSAQTSLDEGSSRFFLEPCDPFSSIRYWHQSMSVGNGLLWMIHEEPNGDGVGIPRGASAFYLSSSGHYWEKSATFRGTFVRIKPTINQRRIDPVSPDEIITIEIPTEIGRGLIHVWETALKHAVYQEPMGDGKAVRMVLGSAPYFFGFRYRYVGQNEGLVAGEALCIQDLGEALMKYVKASPENRGTEERRVRDLIEQFEKQTAISIAHTQ